MSEDDETQLYMAHERIRFLNRELVMQEDPLVQIAALKRKITLSQERAQEIVSMANKRIAYLSELWKEPSQKDVVTSPSVISTDGGRMSDINSSNYNVVFSRAIAALDNISVSKAKFGNLRNEASRIANDIRNFLPMLQSCGQTTPMSRDSIVSTNEISSISSAATSGNRNISTTGSVSLPTGIESSKTLEKPTTELNTGKAKGPPPPTIPATTKSVLVLPTAPPPKKGEQGSSAETTAQNNQPPSNA